MADVRYLETRLSGGASNTDPAAALGGAMSTVAGGIMTSQSFSWSPLSAMTIDRGSGNPPGTGTVTYTSSDTSVTWTPPGGSAGSKVNINTNATYILFGDDATRYIILTKSGTLPVSNTSATVDVTDTLNNLFPDVSFAESLSGIDKQYRCIYIKNTSGDSMTNVQVWLEQDPVGASTMQIGLDPAGAGGTATTIANDTTDPTGVSFSAPSSSSPLTLGTLTTGQSAALWFKRAVPANTTTGRALSPTRIGVLWS